MASKEIQLSTDSGTTWNTLPGSTGTMQVNGTEIDDTILGQTFKSSQPGLLDWSVSSNALYKGFAGYVAAVNITGISTTITAEAANLVSGQIYQITNVAHRVLDRTVAISVLANAVVVPAASIASIDYLTGSITFATAYTVTAPVTITGAYLPMTAIASASGFTLTMTAETVDNTDFTTAQSNGGFKASGYGLRTIAVNLTGFHSNINNYFTLVTGRSEVVIQLKPSGADDAVAIGFFKPKSKQQQGNVGALEQDDIDFTLSVPSSSYAPFEWIFSVATTLNKAVQDFLSAWINTSKLEIKYLQNPAAIAGSQGYSGTGVITEATLKGGLDVMNEFTIQITGDGIITQV